MCNELCSIICYTLLAEVGKRESKAIDRVSARERYRALVMTASDAAVGCCSLLFWTITCIVAVPQTMADSYHVETAVGKSEPVSSKSGILNSNGSMLNHLLVGGGTATVECHSVVQLNGTQWCSFVKTTEDCKLDSGFIDYLQGAVCGFHHNLLPLAILLCAIWLIYLFVFLGTTAELFFCPNLAAIAASLKLSHNVAGVTFLALGNGAPDVFSAIAAFSDPRTANLAIGALFGAGIFVTTVVAGGVALANPFIVASRPFLRDVIFYMAAVFWTFLVLYFGRIDLGQALGYIALYVVYVLTVIISSLIYQKHKNQEPASLYSCQSENGLLRINDQFPVWALVLLISLIIATLIFFTTKNEEPPKYHCVFSFVGFLFSTILINTVATEVVNLLRAFGIIFNLSNTVLGLTLLAWGNSVGDLFSDITLARQGYQRMAIAACFGGIIFNMLFGIGLSSLIQMPYNNYVLEIKCDGLLDWVLVGSLGLSLAMSFISIPVQRFKLGKAYGGILVSFYFIFIVVALLTEAGIIHL
ncbi:mitochondrial sodium/calcium exchanger protein isoform X4 [Stegostoma tigrinum]|uniref:mitochondrial sodium/calcium exchanger protein isoform X4 n=1 Tax=Stegostoma tigrinum TaxID=3053191 RepID=UPI0028701F30|nr:mitochondrial sodium/calcium exchanger protein isoform X4 [Stegostoma tigrinum]